MKIRLNVSTNPQENKRPFLASAFLTGAVGLVALVVLANASWNAWQSSRRVRHDISVAEDEIRVNSQKQEALRSYFKTEEPEQVLDRAGFLNSLIGERSFPWTKIFMDLEETLPAGTRVVEISPHLDNGRAEVELTVGAANEETLIRFLKAMESSKVFSGLTVKQEQVAKEPESSDKIEIDLTVWYSTT
jgi:Tfp pilus assembly protein PilN